MTQKTQLAEHAKRRAELVQRRAEQHAEDAAKAERAKIAAFEESTNALPKDAKRKREADDAGPDAKKPAAHAANPAFWLPSMAPEAETDELQELDKDERPSTTLCIAGSDKPHKLTRKGLVPVHFSTRTVDTQRQYFCPSCKKELALAAQVHVLRACGHTLCTACTKELVHTPLERADAGVACPECSAPVRKAADVIAIAREGTGFAGGGRAEAATKGIAFQG